eukprot:3009538-Rhodomonas_salina.2
MEKEVEEEDDDEERMRKIIVTLALCSRHGPSLVLMRAVLVGRGLDPRSRGVVWGVRAQA